MIQKNQKLKNNSKNLQQKNQNINKASIQKTNFANKKNFFKKITRKIRLGKNIQRKEIDGTAIFKYKINILVKQHNVFCSLTTTKDNKTLHVCSSGKYKVKMSKKILTYTYYWFLRRFFSTVKKLIRVPSVKKILKQGSKITRRPGLIVHLTSPLKITSNIVNTTKYNLRKRPYILKVIDKKIFNGCRPPKKVRKKRRRTRNTK